MYNSNSTWVKIISISPPSLGNNTADSERVSDSLKNILKIDFVKIGLNLLRKIPACLRKWDYCLKCILFKDKEYWILIDVLDPDEPEMSFGIAVDLGTTKIGLRISGLESGNDLYESSFDNPQIKIGVDVLTRIRYAETEDGLNEVNKLVISGLNDMIEQSCCAAGINADNVYIVSVAGNTAMTHFFLKLNPKWVVMEPYIPVTNIPGIFSAIEIGLKVNSNAVIFVFPNIGSYFGGDLIAGILSSGIYKNENVSILVDVGTNAEVVLGNREWLVGCAGAAGPALEGGVTKMGMIAGPGAIDKVRIDPLSGKIDIHTIDDETPVGICGSGLIDLVAHLFLSGMVDNSGKFVKDRCGSRITKVDNVDHFILVRGTESAIGEDLTMSQSDLESMIRSKAAMYAILVTITGTVGMTPNDLDTFYVAGTFGYFIDPKSAISIGMMPDLPLASYKTLKNSSLAGATLVLKSESFINDVYKIRESITYLELNVNQKFMNNFSAAKFLPHTDKSLFPSIKQYSEVSKQNLESKWMSVL